MRAKHGQGIPVWKRNLWVLSVSQFLAVTAISIVLPFIPFFVRELGITDRREVELWSGLIFSGPFLAAALMSPVWGHLGDKHGYKMMVGRAIAALAVTQFLYVFVRTPLQMTTLRVVQGIVTGFIPASLAMTSASTPSANLPGAMGTLYASASAGRLVGPALGGVLAGFMSFRNIFLLVGALTLIGCVIVFAQLQEPPRSVRPENPSVKANLRRVGEDPRLQLALLGMFFSMSAIGMQFPVFPLYVEDLLHQQGNAAFYTGIGFAVVATFTLLTAPFLGKISRRIGLKRSLVGALVICAISLALHPVAHTIAAMLFMRALLGIGTAGIQPALHSMVSRETPEGMRGGITGYANSASIFGFFAGPLAGGWIAGHFGNRGVFEVSAAILFACAIGAAIFAKRRGRQREIIPIPQAT